MTVVKKSTTKGNEWTIIEMYLDNKSEEEIAKEVGCSKISIKTFITKIATGLNQAYQTRQLILSQEMDAKGNKYSWAPTKALDSKVNQLFLKMLSEPDSPVLTDSEMTFCYLLIHEGSVKDAMVDSGLDVGLKQSIGPKEYKRLLELRATYLKSKPNIIEYLKSLQLKYVESLGISKETVQAEIMRTLTYLRNQDDPKHATTIAKLIESLGKTEGVFVDTKQVTHAFSMDESFEIMMQRQKMIAEVAEEDVVPLEVTPSGTYVDPSILEETDDE